MESPNQKYQFATELEPARRLPRGDVRVRPVRVPLDAANAGVLGVDARQGRHGRGRRRGVPRRHVRVEPQARRLPGAQREARHRAGLPLPAAGPRRLDPQRLTLGWPPPLYVLAALMVFIYVLVASKHAVVWYHDAFAYVFSIVWMVLPASIDHLLGSVVHF